jgi:hypothetical protein
MDVWIYMPPAGATATIIVWRSFDTTADPVIVHRTSQIPTSVMDNYMWVNNNTDAAVVRCKWLLADLWRY